VIEVLYQSAQFLFRFLEVDFRFGFRPGLGVIQKYVLVSYELSRVTEFAPTPLLRVIAAGLCFALFISVMAYQNHQYPDLGAMPRHKPQRSP
jgi:hypothetical protein